MSISEKLPAAQAPVAVRAPVAPTVPSLVFGSTPALPATWEGATFLNNRKAWEEPLRKCHCDEEVRPECRGFLPIISIGLAYQHYHCNNMTRLHLWVEQYRRDLADLRSGAIAMPASASPAYWSF